MIIRTGRQWYQHPTLAVDCSDSLADRRPTHYSIRIAWGPETRLMLGESETPNRI